VCVHVTLSEARTKAQHKIMKRSFEDVAKFKCLGSTLTDQNCMHQENKSRINPGIACYHSVQCLPACCLAT
jgi:hypothetical protein